MIYLSYQDSQSTGVNIWLVDEDSTIRPARVDVVRADENYFYISDGLVEGDRYCATAVEQPLLGMKVELAARSAMDTPNVPASQGDGHNHGSLFGSHAIIAANLLLVFVCVLGFYAISILKRNLPNF